MHRGAHGDAPQGALAELRVEPFGELVRAERGADAADVVDPDVGRGFRELLRFDHRDDVHGEGREGCERAAPCAARRRADGASMIPRGQLRAARADAAHNFAAGKTALPAVLMPSNMPRSESVLRRDQCDIMAGEGAADRAARDC